MVLGWRAKSSAGVPMHAIALGEDKVGSGQPAEAAPRRPAVCRFVPGMSPHGQRQGGGPTTPGGAAHLQRKASYVHAASSNAEHNRHWARPRARRVPASALPANESRNKIVCAGACLRGAGPCARSQKQAALGRPKGVRTHELLINAPTEGWHGAHATACKRCLHASKPMPVMVTGASAQRCPPKTKRITGSRLSCPKDTVNQMASPACLLPYLQSP